MKNIFILIPLLAVIAGCNNKMENTSVEKSPTPADIALQATQDFFQLNVDVVESTKDKNSKIKQFNTSYDEYSCYIDVDSDSLKIINMKCQKVEDPSEAALDKVLTPKGKEMYQKSIDDMKQADQSSSLDNS